MLLFIIDYNASKQGEFTLGNQGLIIAVIFLIICVVIYSSGFVEWVKRLRAELQAHNESGANEAYEEWRESGHVNDLVRWKRGFEEVTKGVQQHSVTPRLPPSGFDSPPLESDLTSQHEHLPLVDGIDDATAPQDKI